MTDEEFAAKVEWEGGSFDALFGYGLKSTDLDDQDGMLAAAVRELEALSQPFLSALQKVDDILHGV